MIPSYHEMQAIADEKLTGEDVTYITNTVASVLNTFRLEAPKKVAATNPHWQHSIIVQNEQVAAHVFSHLQNIFKANGYTTKIGYSAIGIPESITIELPSYSELKHNSVKYDEGCVESHVNAILHAFVHEAPYLVDNNEPYWTHFLNEEDVDVAVAVMNVIQQTFRGKGYCATIGYGSMGMPTSITVALP